MKEKKFDKLSTMKKAASEAYVIPPNKVFECKKLKSERRACRGKVERYV